VKTLVEAQKEVEEIINNNYYLADRIEALKHLNYNITYDYIKDVGLGNLFYLSRKKLYRIQIGVGNKCGNYIKAYLVDIPITDRNSNN
jgi:hypothetical protein